MFLDKFVPSPYKTGKLPKKEEKNDDISLAAKIKIVLKKTDYDK